MWREKWRLSKVTAKEVGGCGLRREGRGGGGVWVLKRQLAMNSFLIELAACVCRVSESPMYSTALSPVYILTPYIPADCSFPSRAPHVCVGCQKVLCIL